MTITSDISINAPIEKVFQIFSNLEHAQERITGIQKIEVLEGPKQMKVGTKWREVRVMYGKEAEETMWVTALEPNVSYTVEAESRGVHYTSTYTFTKESHGTHVVLTFASKPLTLGAKLLNVLFFAFAGSTKKLLHQDMQELKNVCESQQNQVK